MMIDDSNYAVVIGDQLYIKNNYGPLRPAPSGLLDWRALFTYNSITHVATLSPGSELELIARCANTIQDEAA
jgi:hypothetical protein